jgi:hypothetical protein
VCGGTLISREQYLPDVRAWGYEDARLTPRGGMTPDQVELWTPPAPNGSEEHA